MNKSRIKKIIACGLFTTFVLGTASNLIQANATSSKNSLKSVTEAYGATPTAQQVDYQKDELTAFIHFGINTFYDVEWGNGNEDPARFNPTKVDADQWVKTLKDGGFKKVIFTAKHHDGFALWPSKTTDHGVEKSPWKDGKGDVVKEVADACKKYGLKFGVYLSPWDQNSPDYGEGNGRDYNEVYMEQLTELLTNYGEVSEVWMDGAKGSNVTQEYKFDEWFKLIKELQPDCTIFSPQGPDIRWIGNENGYAGEPCWSTIDLAKMSEREVPSYLNTGEENGPNWVVGESDVSIRPGWFYHKSQDNAVKSLEKLMDIYTKSVGRNSVLLLNVPPNKEGVLHENDVNRIKEFGDAVKGLLDEDLTDNSTLSVDSEINNDYSKDKLNDNNFDTYWAPNNSAKTGTIEIEFNENTTFDVVSLQEYINLGQRVKEFSVEASREGEEWSEIYSGKTIGYKRYVRVPPTTAKKIRINIKDSLATPLINEINVYKAPKNIELPKDIPDGLKFLNDSNKGTEVNQFNFGANWNYEDIHGDNDRGGDAHWSNKAGSTVDIKFKGSLFYLSAAKDPSHGIMEISIDGGEFKDIDLYSESRKTKQIVYESETLEYGEHTATIRVSGRKNERSTGISGHIDGAFVLDNNGAGLVEFEKISTRVLESTKNPEFKVIRKGGSRGRIEVNYDTVLGSAENLKDLHVWSGTLSFDENETEKVIDRITIIDDDEIEEDENFFVTLSNPIGGIIGFNDNLEVTIEDDDNTYLKINTTDTGNGMNKFTFGEGWNQEANGAWARGENKTYSIKFEGSRIVLIGAKDPNHGLYKIKIDDGEFLEVDPYSENRLENEVIFDSKDLAYGEHTLTFLSVGSNPHGGRADSQINHAFINTKDNGGSGEEILLGDFNKNKKIDLGDLSIASKYYGKNKSEYDINKDNIVDEYEINYIMDNIK
ncbi:alpha-L-fucosidase [Clostridium sardiniense]|uniref:alpha-L-fucosidase n=1 Tax=Clostridium sardiniense TaxID=29369 RepID=A0ABS7L0W9_CLOSR|nr:alpha-L-fucosidase [Clostridium sardiniense]MBY0756714.1 alpha-L-fucosidase [Clostridium sardiniense]MDQ0458536.1 alpha-L-fucosidase [Clostridium sardiniense]